MERISLRDFFGHKFTKIGQISEKNFIENMEDAIHLQTQKLLNYDWNDICSVLFFFSKYATTKKETFSDFLRDKPGLSLALYQALVDAGYASDKIDKINEQIMIIRDKEQLLKITQEDFAQFNTQQKEEINIRRQKYGIPPLY